MQKVLNDSGLKVLSVNELKQFEGMENLSIEEAEHTIQMLQHIVY